MDISADHPIVRLAQPILDTFYAGACAAGCTPSFKPTIAIAPTPGPIRYDPAMGAVVLIPWRVMPAPVQASMQRFASIGTLGLPAEQHYAEIFHRLLIPHELAHWLQVIADKPLSRWQAERDANRVMVAFWREHPDPEIDTERRLQNYTAQPPNFPALQSMDSAASPEETFNTELAAIEAEPARYAAFQKHMVREAMTECPAPTFRGLVRTLLGLG